MLSGGPIFVWKYIFNFVPFWVREYFGFFSRRAVFVQIGQSLMVFMLPRLMLGNLFNSGQTATPPYQMSLLPALGSMCSNVSDCSLAFAPLNETVREQLEPGYSQWRNYLKIHNSPWDYRPIKTLFLENATQMDTLAQNHKVRQLQTPVKLPPCSPLAFSVAALCGSCF